MYFMKLSATLNYLTLCGAPEIVANVPGYPAFFRGERLTVVGRLRLVSKIVALRDDQFVRNDPKIVLVASFERHAVFSSGSEVATERHELPMSGTFGEFDSLDAAWHALEELLKTACGVPKVPEPTIDEILGKPVEEELLVTPPPGVLPEYDTEEYPSVARHAEFEAEPPVSDDCKGSPDDAPF